MKGKEGNIFMFSLRRWSSPVAVLPALALLFTVCYNVEHLSVRRFCGKDKRTCNLNFRSIVKDRPRDLTRKPSTFKAAPTNATFNGICDSTSRCSFTRQLLATKFVEVRKRVRLVCVEMSKTGFCFFPMHHGDADNEKKSLSDALNQTEISSNSKGKVQALYTPTGLTMMNYLQKVTPFFVDLCNQLSSESAGAAVINLNDTARTFLTSGDIAKLHRAGSPLLAHNIDFEHRHSDFLFMPDYHFITNRGYAAELSRFEKVSVPFEKRKPTVFWRGATNGPHISCLNSECDPCERCGASPRIQLTRAARSISGADIEITHWDRFCESCGKNLPRDASDSKYVTEPDWYKNRGTVDIAGKADSWGAYKRYRSGSVVLRVEDDWMHWYDQRLTPWTHYIPVRRDLSDLAERVRDVVSEKAEDIKRVKQIAEVAKGALVNITYTGEVARVARDLEVLWSGVVSAAI